MRTNPTQGRSIRPSNEAFAEKHDQYRATETARRESSVPVMPRRQVTPKSYRRAPAKMFDINTICTGAPRRAARTRREETPDDQAPPATASRHPVRTAGRPPQSEYGTWLRAQFARNLRELREHKGLTQGALAHDAQLSRKFLNQVERGHHSITLETVAALAQALDVSMSTLLGESAATE